MKRRIIYHKNYKEPFEDRREENGDMRLKDWFTPTIIITLVIGAIAIGGYKFVIQATADQVKCQAIQISSLDNKVNLTDNKVSKIETEIPNIKESIQRIETSQIETQKDIKQLLRQAKHNE